MCSVYTTSKWYTLEHMHNTCMLLDWNESEFFYIQFQKYFAEHSLFDIHIQHCQHKEILE